MKGQVIDFRMRELDRLIAADAAKPKSSPAIRRRYRPRAIDAWIERRREYLIRAERLDLLEAEGLQAVAR